MLRARAAVQNLKEYHPPLGGRIGLRLDFNENTQGASPLVLQRLREIDAEQLASYPDREPVEREVAAFLGLQPQQALLTNGVDEAIHLLCQTFLEVEDEAIVIVPTFSMYELFAASTGAKVVAVSTHENFGFPASSLLRAINPRTRLIVIANPNNPTGAVANSNDLLAIAKAAPHAAVLIDEAYFEFYGETMLREIPNMPNLFVARTFSKAYGLAGLRIGVLLGPAEPMRMARKVASPYNVNAVALAALPLAFKDQRYLDRYVAAVRRGRDRLQHALRSIGIPYWPSHANFVLADFGSKSRVFVQAMSQHGILVRDRSADPGCAGCVRITVGTDPQTDFLLATLQTVSDEIGLPQRVAR